MFKVRGQLRAEVYVSDIPDDAWPTGVDIREPAAQRHATEEGHSAEAFIWSGHEGEDPGPAEPRVSGKATEKRPVDEGPSRREGQSSRLRTGEALNIGVEEGTRKRRRALLDMDDNDDEDSVPLS
jgi:hypothetical protein